MSPRPSMLARPARHLGDGRQKILPLVAGMVRACRVRACRVCGCIDADCRQCVQRTGQPCHWVAPDLCSACQAPGILSGGQSADHRP